LATGLTAGAHKVKVNNVKDFADFPILAKEFDVTIAVDTAAPTAVSASAVNSQTVRVAFNEPIDAATVVAQNFKVVSGTTQVPVLSVTPVAGDSKQVEIVLNGKLDLSAVVTAQVKYNNLADNYGNKVTTEQSVGFTAQDDTVLPSILNVTTKAGNTAEITFSEDVQNVNAADFVLLKDNKEVTNAVATVTAKTIDGTDSKKVYTATFNNASALSGAYTLKLKKENDVKDLSIRENNALEQLLAVSFGDVKSPEFTSASFKSVGENYEVTVRFNEAMLVSSVTDKANYIVDGKQLNTIEGATAAAGADAKSVVISVPKTSVTLVAGEVPFKLLGVKDVAGNTLLTADFNTPLTAAPFVQTPALTDVVVGPFSATAKKSIKIPVTTGNTVQNVDVNKITFVNDATGATVALQATGAQVKSEADGSKYIELSLLQSLDADGTLGGVDVAAQFAAGAILLDNGATTLAYEGLNKITVSVDAIAPSLVVPSNGKIATDNDNDTVTLAFDEAVSGSALELALVIRDENGTRINPSKYTAVANPTPAATDDNQVVITFSDVSVDGPVTVSLSDNIVLTDGTNLANDFAAVSSETLTVLTDAAEALTAAKADAATAKTEGQAAQSDYVANGGLNTASVYTDVTNAIAAQDAAVASNVTADIQSATTALDSATSALTTATAGL
jgi:hypothetical protein